MTVLSILTETPTNEKYSHPPVAQEYFDANGECFISSGD